MNTLLPSYTWRSSRSRLSSSAAVNTSAEHWADGPRALISMRRSLSRGMPPLSPPLTAPAGPLTPSPLLPLSSPPLPLLLLPLPLPLRLPLPLPLPPPLPLPLPLPLLLVLAYSSTSRSLSSPTVQFRGTLSCLLGRSAAAALSHSSTTTLKPSLW